MRQLLPCLLLLTGCAGTPPAAPPISDNELQTRALLLLLGDRQGHEAVTSRLALDGGPAIREALAVALGRTGDGAAVESLAGLLVDDVVAVRRAAAFGLGEVAEAVEAARPRATERLLAAVADIDRETGRLAVEALGKIGTPVLTVGEALLPLAEDERWARLAPALYRFQDLETIPLALAALGSPEADLHRWGAFALARTPKPESLPTLRTLLADPSPEIRAWAARALGIVGEPTDLDRLRPLLDDAVDLPVYPALRAAKSQIDKGAPAPAAWRSRLLRLIDDARPGVRQVALDVAGTWLPAPELAAALVARTRAGAPVGERGAALLALATAADPAAGAAVELFAAATEPGLRAKAVEAAGLLGTTAVLDRLADDAVPLVRGAVLGARLARVGDDVASALPIARAGLADRDSAVRGGVLDWLVEHPVVPVEELELAVRRALGDSGVEERISAVSAVVARAKGEALERGALVEILEKLVRGADLVTARRAADGLVALDRPRPPEAPNAQVQTAEFYESVVRQTLRPRLAEVVTSRGTFRIRLACPEAPLTCLNFLKLAESRYFDGLTFHRVVPGFVIQGGDPRGDGTGGPGYTIRDEINRRRYERGAVGMALSGPHTGGSQWFVTLSPQPHLDGGYTMFGEVVAGLEVVDRILAGDTIVSVREVD
jgi:cyclophilin family peptidyl-prolyl cis-trans isomerase/HEAT repeat protein